MKNQMETIPGGMCPHEFIEYTNAYRYTPCRFTLAQWTGLRKVAMVAAAARGGICHRERAGMEGAQVSIAARKEERSQRADRGEHHAEVSARLPSQLDESIRAGMTPPGRYGECRHLGDQLKGPPQDPRRALTIPRERLTRRSRRRVQSDCCLRWERGGGGILMHLFSIKSDSQPRHPM